MKKIILLMAIFLLVGCSSANEDYKVALPESMEIMEMGEMSAGGGYAKMADSAPRANSAMPDIAMPNRKMIKNGNMNIETTAFDESIDVIFTKIEELGGFIESYSVYGKGDTFNPRSAYMQVRIPEEEFNNFIDDTADFGVATSKSIDVQDITDQYVDTELRIKSLETQRDRLLELLKEAGTLTELFEIEKELNNVIYELELAQGSLNKYDSLLDFSTIDITVREVYEYVDAHPEPVTFMDRIIQAFKDSFKNLFAVIQSAIVAFVLYLPFIAIIAIIIIILIKVFRVKKRK